MASTTPAITDKAPWLGCLVLSLPRSSCCMLYSGKKSPCQLLLFSDFSWLIKPEGNVMEQQGSHNKVIREQDLLELYFIWGFLQQWRQLSPRPLGPGALTIPP